jgi:cytochrome c oxidase subunit 4
VTENVVHEEVDHHNDPEQIRREIRVYKIIFASLLLLTVLTVGVIKIGDVPIHYAIMIALAIAITKGFLVAGFFMHLLSEKKLIYAVLGLTVIFFAFLIWLPLHDIADKMGK